MADTMQAHTTGGTVGSSSEKGDARRHRAKEVGVVTSDRGDKTIKVTVAYKVKHPLYGKYVPKRLVLHAHDEKNEANNGDRVELMSCRRISKTKCWRLVRVVEKFAER